MDTIPVSALELGIGFGEYEKVARNISRMMLIPKRARQEILERADKELSQDVIKNAIALIDDMANDRDVYEIAGLKYWKGPPEGENFFTTAVFDYLLTARYF